MGWVNYTSTQAETSLDPDTKAPKIRMHEMGTQAGISDEAGTRHTWSWLATPAAGVPPVPIQGLRPEQTSDEQTRNRGPLKPGEGPAGRGQQARWREMVEKAEIDWDQINPAYFKMKKDYARTDTPFRPVQAKFDMPTVKQVLAKPLADDGVPKAVVEIEIADKLMALIEEYKGPEKDIGLVKPREAGMIDAARGHGTIKRRNIPFMKPMRRRRSMQRKPSLKPSLTKIPSTYKVSEAPSIGAATR